MIINPATIVGSAGAILLLGAFIELESGRWRKGNFKYELSNFIGGALLVIYSVLLLSYPFLILNLIWALVALRDLLRPRTTKRRSA